MEVMFGKFFKLERDCHKKSLPLVPVPSSGTSGHLALIPSHLSSSALSTFASFPPDCPVLIRIIMNFLALFFLFLPQVQQDYESLFQMLCW